MTGDDKTNAPLFGDGAGTSDRTLFDADRIPAMVFVYRADGRCDYRNQRYYNLTGLDPVRDGDSRWGAALHPDDHAPVRERWRESVLLNVPFEGRYRLRMADGTYRWHVERAEPHYDDGTEAILWYGVAIDIHGLPDSPP
ncbi:PAS domain-containing protein [Azospirillum sp. RWY-5-1]|uniref:histidine kinase n=1 Tax=Azospirillum oleiclasticum TaxID=2735135 RepID=A0ABX2TD24_9PROT|nr:PAS domain-containing protein [Azospirillum oleiclasticum]NYZ14846.1 PAS domain-containing protein [Azospirillum oleiclasticum]NYZ22168.1 PAS domain-containing protein [Azospirillum oleiclasticum]